MARKIIPFSAVLAMNGYEVKKETSSGDLVTICPWCKNDTLWVKDEKNTGHCWSCARTSNPITFHMQACGISEYKQALLDAKKKLESGEYSELIAHESESAKTSYVSPIMIRNKTYVTLFKYLGLSEDHKKNLEDRGMNHTFLYRTLDFKVLNESELIENLLKAGCKLQGVAPFYYENGKWHIKKYPRGILVPYMDSNSMIQGLQLRIDDDLLKPYTGKDGKTHTPSKYVWLSSGDKENGTRGESYGSYLCNYVNYNNMRVATFRNGICTITEGAMKGDIAHQLSGKSFWALAGVNAQGKRFEKELKNLKSLGVSTIEIAFDMDRFLNISVLAAIKKMCETVKANGFKLRILSWNTEYALFNGDHRQLEMFKDFVFTPESYKRAVSKERLDYVVSAVKDFGISNIFFAFANKDEAINNQDLFNEFKKKYGKDILITPIIWKLRLKGIDNYYAYEVKHIL